MKKVLAMILAIVMLVSVLCVGVSADENAPAFVVDSVSARAGQTVSVSIRTQNNPGIVGLRVALGYDASVLTPTAMVEKDFAGASFGPLDANPLSVLWVDAIHPNVTTDGAVAEITFQVAADAAVGEYPLTLSLVDSADIFNSDMNEVAFETIDGAVSVISYKPGDVNDDTKVNLKDLGLLQQHLNGWEVTINLAACDVTGDGKVNLKDLGILQQYLNGWDVTLGGGSQPEDPDQPGEPEPPVEEDDVLTIEEAIAMGSAMEHNIYTEDKYYVTGVITEVYNTQYGNMKIADEAGNILTIYGTYSADGELRYDAMEVKPVAGDTVTIYGIVGQYNGTPQIKNGWITEHTAAEKPDEPVDPNPPVVEGVVDAPVADTAYKFGMIQGNVSADAVYYLNGGMNSYYMDTTTDVNAAIDVYLEATNGGYYLYTKDEKGTKSYINMVVSGTHVNGQLGAATATTIYTFDADAKTIVADVDGAPYWFGTRNDKTYTTVGPCKTEYAGFYCQFYATAGGDEPVDPKPDVPVGETITIADAIALGSSMEHNNYTNEKYFVTGVIAEVYNTQYGNMHLTDGNGNTLTIYGTYGADGTVGYASLEVKPVAGDTVTIYGAIGQYSNNPQIKNGWIVDHIPGEGGNEPDEPIEGAVTITFDDIAKRTELSTEIQVWQENGITVTNEKAGSTTAVADYSNPVRFYKGSSLLIEYKGMTQIVFKCDGNKPSYATDLAASITDGTVKTEGTSVTVTFDAPVDSLFIAGLAAQVRVMNITVIGETGGDEPVDPPVDPDPECKHEYFSDCDIVCLICGEITREASHNVIAVEAKAATCTETGNIAYWFCDVCGAAWLDAECTMNTNLRAVKLPATDHVYTTAYDADCNVCGATREVPEVPVLPENPYDPLNNLDVVSEHVGLERFGAHPEMAGKSVAMRAPAALSAESYLIYKNEGNVASAISVGVVVMDNWGLDLAVSGRNADGEWVALEYTSTPVFEIPGASNPAFKQAICTVIIPANYAEVKIALINTGAAWTFAIDYVDITWQAASEEPEEPEEPDVPSEPVVNHVDFNTIVPAKDVGDSSYTNTYTTTSGWVTEFSAIQSGGTADVNPQFTVIGPDKSYRAVCMNGKTSAPGKITSPVLTGGINKLTINYTKMFTDVKLGATITITDLTTGAVYTNSLYREADKNDKYIVWTYEWVLETPIAGDFTIVILNDCPSAATTNKDRLTVLDIIWETTGAAGGDTPVDPEPDVPVDPEPDVPVDPEPDEPAVPDVDNLTIADAIALGSSMEHNTYTEQKYYVTGVITEVYNSVYGNMKITDDNGNILTIYGTYSADGALRYDAMEVKPVAGDTVTIYGIVGQYNGTPQIKNGWITAHTAGEQPEVPSEPDAPLAVVTAPVADTAYKFGMIQGNVSADAVYYLNGSMNSYYMDTTTNAASAIDVYLEETAGGYYLYTKDEKGTKSYINMVVSGTHVNGQLGAATATTVYTFDAESGTLIAEIDGAPYWFGTRNDKTYTTVGPVKVEYAGFYCQLYA